MNLLHLDRADLDHTGMCRMISVFCVCSCHYLPWGLNHFNTCTSNEKKTIWNYFNSSILNQTLLDKPRPAGFFLQDAADSMLSSFTTYLSNGRLYHFLFHRCRRRFILYRSCLCGFFHCLDHLLWWNLFKHQMLYSLRVNVLLLLNERNLAIGKLNNL